MPIKIYMFIVTSLVGTAQQPEYSFEQKKSCERWHF